LLITQEQQYYVTLLMPVFEIKIIAMVSDIWGAAIRNTDVEFFNSATPGTWEHFFTFVPRQEVELRVSLHLCVMWWWGSFLSVCRASCH